MKEPTLVINHSAALNVTTNAQHQAIWRDMKEPIQEINPSAALNVTRSSLIQAVWEATKLNFILKIEVKAPARFSTWCLMIVSSYCISPQNSHGIMSGSILSSCLAFWSILCSSSLDILVGPSPPTTWVEEALLLFRDGRLVTLDRRTLVGFTHSACKIMNKVVVKDEVTSGCVKLYHHVSPGD